MSSRLRGIASELRTAGGVLRRTAGRLCRRGRVAGALVAFALLFCIARGASAQIDTELSDAIVARVNGEPILLSELREAAFNHEVPVSALTSEGLMGEGFRVAITAQIDQKLLVQKARSDEIEPNELAVTQRVDAFIQELVNNLGGEVEFAEFLRSSHLSLESLRRVMISREHDRELSTAVVARRVSTSGPEIEAFRMRRAESGKAVEEVKLAQILIHCPRAEQDTELGGRQFHRALEIVQSVGRDPEQFFATARESSDDEAGRLRSGMLGWLDPDALNDAIKVRVATMRPGEISEPVAAGEGYHILLLLDRHSTRDLLFAERFESERASLLDELREKALIETFPPSG